MHLIAATQLCTPAWFQHSPLSHALLKSWILSTEKCGWLLEDGHQGFLLIGMSLSTSSNCSLTSSITTCFPPDLLDLPSVVAIEAHLFPLPSTPMTKGQQTLSFLVYSLLLPISRPQHSQSLPLKHSMNP
jgi:hypothetical protein